MDSRRLGWVFLALVGTAGLGAMTVASGETLSDDAVVVVVLLGALVVLSGLALLGGRRCPNCLDTGFVWGEQWEKRPCRCALHRRPGRRRWPEAERPRDTRGTAMNGREFDLRFLVDELTYAWYRDNRARSPEIAPERWAQGFRQASTLEHRYQTEKTQSAGAREPTEAERTRETMHEDAQRRKE